jgi:hypothetical protein
MEPADNSIRFVKRSQYHIVNPELKRNAQSTMLATHFGLYAHDARK